MLIIPLRKIIYSYYKVGKLPGQAIIESLGKIITSAQQCLLFLLKQACRFKYTKVSLTFREVDSERVNLTNMTASGLTKNHSKCQLCNPIKFL